jgi:hypothetical protein
MLAESVAEGPPLGGLFAFPLGGEEFPLGAEEESIHGICLVD